LCPKQTKPVLPLTKGELEGVYKICGYTTERDLKRVSFLLPFSQNWEKGLGDKGKPTDDQSDQFSLAQAV
jgi:hypothetical protein